MESTDSSTGSQQQPNLPPGFRFHPTDEELVVHYLKRKLSSAPLPVSIIAEVDLYKFDPWELPPKAMFGEQEWYFFSPRDRKYPNGARPNRAATSGYWKATGTDKPVLTSGGTQKVGVKKALVFYGGKPPKGIKTNWIMHEYRLIENKTSNKPPGCDLGNKKNSLRLDDWVLCRIYKKHNTNRPMDHDKEQDSMEDMMFGSIHGRLHLGTRGTTSYGTLLENESNLFEGVTLMSNNLDNSGNSSISQLGSSSSKELSMVPPKRTLPSLYWGTIDDQEDSSKRFHGDQNNSTNDGTGSSADHHANTGSIATLFSQLPQNPSLQQQQQQQQHMVGSMGDGMFRPPYHQLPAGMNWFT
ncbi:hypothetical protein ACFE04_005240 [Oxalis oulophora]